MAKSHATRYDRMHDHGQRRRRRSAACARRMGRVDLTSANAHETECDAREIRPRASPRQVPDKFIVNEIRTSWRYDRLTVIALSQ
jgi:hypothetical protein